MTSDLVVGCHEFYIVPHLGEVAQAYGAYVQTQQPLEYGIVAVQRAQYPQPHGTRIMVLAVMITVLAGFAAEFPSLPSVNDLVSAFQADRTARGSVTISHGPYTVLRSKDADCVPAFQGTYKKGGGVFMFFYIPSQFQKKTVYTKR